MSAIYFIPAAVLWIVWGGSPLIGVPWWLDYIIFGTACAASAVGVFLAMLSSAGPRW